MIDIFLQLAHLRAFQIYFLVKRVESSTLYELRTDIFFSKKEGHNLPPIISHKSRNRWNRSFFCAPTTTTITVTVFNNGVFDCHPIWGKMLPIFVRPELV